MKSIYVQREGKGRGVIIEKTGTERVGGGGGEREAGGKWFSVIKLRQSALSMRENAAGRLLY